MDYHSLMNCLTAAARSGHFGNGEIRNIFCGPDDLPYKFIVIDRETFEVRLGVLNRNGSILFGDIAIASPFATENDEYENY